MDPDATCPLALACVTPPASPTTMIPLPMFPRVILGWSWHLHWRTATLWWCMSARTSTHFKQLALPPSSVLSTRFPQLSWLGASSSSPMPKLWHLQPSISLLRPSCRPPWPVISSSSSTRLLQPPWKCATHLTLLAPCSCTSQEPAWPLAEGTPLPLGLVLLLLASGFPLPCPQQSLRQVSLTSKFLMFRLCPALLVLIPLVWMILLYSMGGRQYQPYSGSYGGPPCYHGGSCSQHHTFSFPSSGLTANYWRTYKFPGGNPSAAPSFIHGLSPPHPSHGGPPHVSASVASTLAPAAHLLRPLMHEDWSGSSALDLLMSFWPSLSAVIVPPVVPSAVVPPVAPVLPPVPVPAPPVINVDSVGDSTLLVPAPVLIICPSEPFKLPPIADAKAYFNLSSILQYYLRCPDFLTQRSDDAHVTDLRNAEASVYWEGQIRVALQDGSLCFLFENKGSMYDGKGFKMLAALNQHCRPNSVANAFTTLMLLLNDSMGELEEIMAFQLRFDGMVNSMPHCKIILPPGHMVMFFLCSLHFCYNDLLVQFYSCYKSLEGASLDSIVADVQYHNEFKLVGSNKKVPAGKGPKAVASTASSAVDKQRKEWRNPYEWLTSFDIKGIKKHWTSLLTGNGFCPICHCDKDKHAPTTCLLLAELNLKLIWVSPSAGPSVAAPAPAASPSPGGVLRWLMRHLHWV
jgi:hypothetical protein